MALHASSVAVAHNNIRYASAANRSGVVFHQPCQSRRVDASAVRARKSKVTYEPMEDEADKKAVVLDRVIASLNTKFGAGTLLKMGDEGFNASTEVFSSGCMPLDIALGGGYPKGRIVEIFGPESSGKSTLGLHAIAEVQKKGGNAVFIDMEHAFDAAYAAKLGVDMKRLVMSQPKDAEEALEIMDEVTRSCVVDLVVLDSVAALVPRSELNGEMGATQVGSQARLLSIALRKLVPSAGKSKTTLMFLNQIRNKIGVMYGNPETTSGGNALKFYASQRIDLRRKEYLSSAEQSNYGTRVRAKVVKNKVGPPAREAMFDIFFNSGIDALGSLVEAAESCKIVERRGSYYYFGEEKLGQGKDKVKDALINNAELRARIEEATRMQLSALPPPPMEEEEDGEVLEVPADE